MLCLKEERVDIGGDGWDHIYLLQDLEQVGVEFIQKLKLLIEGQFYHVIVGKASTEGRRFARVRQ